MNQFQVLKSDSILTAIEIKHKAMEVAMTKRGFSYITYGLYNFIALFSVHEQISN